MQNERIPAWLSRGIIISLVTLGVGGMGLWVSNLNTAVSAAAVINAVQDNKFNDHDREFQEIKATLLRMEDKLDDALKERRVVTTYRAQPRQSKPAPKDEFLYRVGGLSGPDPDTK